jgi:hypothetical protein
MSNPADLALSAAASGYAPDRPDNDCADRDDYLSEAQSGRAVHDAGFISRLRKVRPFIKDNWSLCDFLGACEREYLVAETICAAVKNLETYGEPFSFRGAGVFTSGGNGLIDNGSAYRWLLDNDYFSEADCAGDVVIFPTAKLLTALEAFFKIGAP